MLRNFICNVKVSQRYSELLRDLARCRSHRKWLLPLVLGDKIQGARWGQQKRRKPPFVVHLGLNFEAAQGGLKSGLKRLILSPKRALDYDTTLVHVLKIHSFHQAFLRETKVMVRVYCQVSLQEYLFTGSSKVGSCGFW